MCYNTPNEIAVRAGGNCQRLYAIGVAHLMKYTPEQRIIAFWNKVAITADDNQCWLWIAGCNSNGYGKFGNKYKQFLAHRIAWSYPDYIIPDGMFVCHSCDNPTCCNPKHLFLGTHQDNMRDMANKNRSGERNPIRKLTQEQVDEIRVRYAAGGIYQRELAAEYGVSQMNISIIVRHIWWRETV